MSRSRNFALGKLIEYETLALASERYTLAGSRVRPHSKHPIAFNKCLAELAPSGAASVLWRSTRALLVVYAPRGKKKQKRETWTALIIRTFVFLEPDARECIRRNSGAPRQP